MSPLPAGILYKDNVLIGNDAGWLLSFHRETMSGDAVSVVDKPELEIGRDDYYAEINASLPGGLKGGTYSFTIEGLTDKHYRRLKKGDLLVVRLFLYWRDTNAGALAYVKNVAGFTDTFKADQLGEFLVAELSIVSISRKAGKRRYETTIEARERVFELLSQTFYSPTFSEENANESEGSKFSDPLAAAMEVALPVDKVNSYPLSLKDQADTGKKPGKKEKQPAKEQRRLDILQGLGRSMEEATGKMGRGMFLIRNGTLHIGERPFPLESDAFDLTMGNGLIGIHANPSAKKDLATNPHASANMCLLERQRYTLTCKGRPDIKPGDIVRFDLPDEEVVGLVERHSPFEDLFGGPIIPTIGTSKFKNETFIYVESVAHKLGRISGFSTIVVGVTTEKLSGNKEEDDKKIWDIPPRRSLEPKEDQEYQGGTPEERVAQAVNRRVQKTLASKRFSDVGEVRQMASKTDSSGEPPSQSLDLWRGLDPRDGRDNQARRLGIKRPSPSILSGVPYTSPFAWGKCGLVLPRYPGTRVLVSHRQGEQDDPIEIGALWESGEGPESQAGDWWLILPVGAPTTIAENQKPETPPPYHKGKVSQDLIDADGNRVIEVGELTIRIAPQDKLKDAGQRPEHGQHIEGGASIIIKADGSVSIQAKKIEFDAGDGEITMKAKKIDVEVTDSMDVR